MTSDDLDRSMIRRRSANYVAYVRSSRSIIRVIALIVALFGLLLIGGELVEHLTNCAAGACGKIHLSTMLWGLTCTILGCLILQRGDVSVSLREITTAGNNVASWFGRRAYDRAPVAVSAPDPIAVPPTPHTPDPAAPPPTARDD